MIGGLHESSQVLSRGCLVLVAAVACPFPAFAQCTASWSGDDGYPGAYGVTNPSVAAMVTWDPDGAGPRGEVLVLGGRFQGAGTRLAVNVATYDPASGEWGNLGTGVSGLVSALAVLPNGTLCAGGDFLTAGGAPANYVAQWTGTGWQPLGLGVSHSVAGLAALPNGDLVAVGAFTSAGGVAANHVARWDGTSWSPLGNGVTFASPTATATAACVLALPNGDLVVGGAFDTAGATAANNIARWDGATWNALGPGTNGGNFSPSVHALARMPNGDLVATGGFSRVGTLTVNGIARWNGTAWSAFGSGFLGSLSSAAGFCLQVLPNGQLVAGGSFVSAGGVGASNIARWTGSAWQALGAGLQTLPGFAMCSSLVALANGDLFAGGKFELAGGRPAMNIARYTNNSWQRVGSGCNSRVLGLAATAAGDVVAGGVFTTAGTVDANFVARRTGTSWSALGTGIVGTCNVVHVRPNGHVVASGTIAQAGGVSVRNIALWNGTSWQAMGTGLSSRAYAFLERSNGDLLAAGWFDVGGTYQALVAWNGTSWQPFAPGLQGGARVMLQLPNGDLVVGGDFSYSYYATVYERIARWNGASWQPLGAGFTQGGYSGTFVKALVLLPNGHILAAGSFTRSGTTTVNRIAEWNGSAWMPLGAGLGDTVNAMLVRPDGSVLVGGAFLGGGGFLADRVARWDGSAWHAVDAGFDATVEALVQVPNGDVFAGGWFARAGSVLAPFCARLTPTCPALASSFGGSCAGSAGPMQLAATSLPWIGSVFESTCQGLAVGSLRCALLGLTSPATPLSSLHPAGVPNCLLLAAPDAALLLSPVGSAANSAFPMPLDPVFAGYVLQHQVLQMELGPGGALTTLTGSNGLALTIGVL